MKHFVFASSIAFSMFVSGRIHAVDETFDSKGVKIRYVSEGTGEAIVLIHGWMADSSMWGRDASGETKLKAAPGSQLIAIDCRGHGKSDASHEAKNYDAEVAGDVVRLLDHLKIKKAHLVGYSSGCFVAGKVMAIAPDRVQSVVFAGQAPIIGEPKPADFSECDLFAKLVDEGKDLGEYLREVMPAHLPKLTEEQARIIAKMQYGKKNVKAFAAAGRGFKHLAATVEEYKKCDAPIIFIHGSNESNHVKTKVANAKSLLGRGEIKIIEGGDHMTTLAKPEFEKVLKEFIGSHPVK